MAHTDRDDDWHYWRRHWHSDECTLWQRRRYAWGNYYLPQACEICASAPWPFQRVLGPIADAPWRRSCRREERARARTIMQRARSGHIDWDDLVIDYRRPYYW